MGRRALSFASRPEHGLPAGAERVKVGLVVLAGLERAGHKGLRLVGGGLNWGLGRRGGLVRPGLPGLPKRPGHGRGLFILIDAVQIFR